MDIKLECEELIELLDNKVIEKKHYNEIEFSILEVMKIRTILGIIRASKNDNQINP